MEARLSAVHLACGAGGITLGFEQAGIRTAYAFDVWSVAVETHLANFPDAPCEVRDIRQVRAADLPAADVWACGIPCEPYSMAGKRQHEADPRDIAFDVARLIQEGRPRYVFLENVPPFQSSAGAEAVRQALDGYATLEAVFLHADWGVPQMRKRWHIIASLESPAPGPEPTHSEQPTLFYQQPWVRFGAIRDGVDAAPISAKALRYMFNRVAKSAAKYGNAYAPNVVTEYDLLPTILATTYKGLYAGSHLIIYEDGKLRHLTVLEARRAQGFPDGFKIGGNLVEQWQQVGRAVPPPFARAVGQVIVKHSNAKEAQNGQAAIAA